MTFKVCGTPVGKCRYLDASNCGSDVGNVMVSGGACVHRSDPVELLLGLRTGRAAGDRWTLCFGIWFCYMHQQCYRMRQRPLMFVFVDEVE